MAYNSVHTPVAGLEAGRADQFRLRRGIGFLQAMRRNQRGDTLVEVLMAVVVLSMVIVGAITLVNRSLAAIQIATEHTQVRLHINSQAELLRRMRDGYQASAGSALGQEWASLFSGAPVYASTAASSNGGTCQVTSGKRPFYVVQQPNDIKITTFNPAAVPPTGAIPGQGLWIEATRSPSGVVPGYVDFQFRACWDAAGASSGQQQTLTVLRLYDPAH